jgi:prepilin-type N-terminal cleavage/methylation domain-containing protein
MTLRTKIKAFTLSEMLVVMVITLIVVGLAFAVLGLVRRQMHGIQAHLEKQTELNLLRRSLWYDLRSSPEAIISKDGLLLLSSPIKSTTYYFGPEKILKNQDTLNFGLLSAQFYFEGNPTKVGPIDALKLILDNKGTKDSVFVYRLNDAKTMMR